MVCADLARLQPYLESVQLKFREQLEAPNRKIKSAYFIESGIASVVAGSRGRHGAAEVGIVGREGMTGLSIVLGAERSPYETFIQGEGEAQRIDADDLRRVMSESESLAALFFRYGHVFLIQAGHTALANAQGKVEERLARWLLMAHDRGDGDDLMLTHEFLALMLGVRRAGVTSALHGLESKALISTARSSVTVLDRDGLEEAANGLYGAPESEFERLFPSSETSVRF